MSSFNEDLKNNIKNNNYILMGLKSPLIAAQFGPRHLAVAADLSAAHQQLKGFSWIEV